jgi:hypothetical protein
LGDVLAPDFFYGDSWKLVMEIIIRIEARKPAP